MPTPPARIRPHCEGTLGQVSPRHFRSRRRDYRVSSHDFKPGSAVAISYQHFAVASLRAVWRPSRLGNHQSRRHRAREPRSNPRETIGLRPRPGSRTHAATLATCFGVLCLSLDGRQTFQSSDATQNAHHSPDTCTASGPDRVELHIPSTFAGSWLAVSLRVHRVSRAPLYTSYLHSCIECGPFSLLCWGSAGFLQLDVCCGTRERIERIYPATLHGLALFDLVRPA